MIAFTLAAIAAASTDSSNPGSPRQAATGPVTSTIRAPHGRQPTIYAGPGGRAQLSGLWRYERDRLNMGLRSGWQRGGFGGRLVTTPFVPDATQISGDAGVANFKGTIGWYRTHLDVSVDREYAIRFESINHRAQIFLDGKRVATHTGEFLPFEIKVRLRPGVRHALVVRADWRNPKAMKADGWHRLWFNFGGINRGVTIRPVGLSELRYPNVQTKLAADGSATVQMRVHVRNNATTGRKLGVRGTLTRGDRSAKIDFAPEAVGPGGVRRLQGSVRIDKPDLWSPEKPALWDLSLEVPSDHTSYRARVGLRQVRASGQNLLLNGKRIRLRGASIHEDVYRRGDALLPVDQDRIVAHLKAIGANATRSQHPLDEGLLERLDAAGIMVWLGVGPTDAPGSWTSRGPRRALIAKERVRTAVRQSQLHPSIITWNLANEVAGSGHPAGQIAYVDAMAAELKAVDPGRPIALDIWGAHPPRRNSFMYRNIDMIGWTNYIGWYESANASAATLRSEIRRRLGKLRRVFPKKIIAVTEFGAEASHRNRTTSPGGYAFQAHLLDLHLSTYRRIPNLAGALIWNLRDFALIPTFSGGSIRRQAPNIKVVRGINEKGLFDLRMRAKPSVKAVAKRFAGWAEQDAE